MDKIYIFLHRFAESGSMQCSTYSHNYADSGNIIFTRPPLDSTPEYMDEHWTPFCEIL